MSQASVFVFWGEPFQREQALKETIQKLEAQANLGQYTFEGATASASELQEALFAPSLFEPGRWVLLRHADEFKDAGLLLKLLEKGIPQGSYLLLDVDKLDKRGALYKWLKANACIQEFAALDRRTLPGKLKWLLQAKGLDLTGEAFQYLATTLPSDLLHIQHEVDKLALYAGKRRVALEEVQGLLFGGQQANVFQFFDTLGERKPQALAQYQRLLEGGEEPGKLFYMLAGHMRSLLMIKALQREGLPPPDIAKRSGLAPWMINRRLQQTRQWGVEELVEAIHRLHERDVQIKLGQCQIETVLLGLILEWTSLVATEG